MFTYVYMPKVFALSFIKVRITYYL